jgi:hypothetical protein
MAKFETVPIGELKHRLPAKLLPIVEEYREKPEKLTVEPGGPGPTHPAKRVSSSIMLIRPSGIGPSPGARSASKKTKSRERSKKGA